MLVKIIGKYLSNISSHIIKSKVKTYNIAEIVKDYCKYPKWLYLPFNIHHGWYASILPRIKDLSPKTYPIMLVWNMNGKNTANWLFVLLVHLLYIIEEKKISNKKIGQKVLLHFQAIVLEILLFNMI